MSDTIFRVDLNLDHLTGLADYLLRDVLSAVSGAVQATAAETAADWQVAIYHTPGIRPDEKSLAIDSIKWRQSGQHAAVVWSDEEIVDRVELGWPERDLKRMLSTSKRTRVNKAGKRYLIIPFRHNTPGNSAHAKTMPPAVYAQAKGLAPSSVIGKTTRVSGSGHTVPQSVYKWGGRLPAGLTPKAKPHHTTDLHAGMVRMNTSVGKKKSSAYLTFRVMREDQTGKWIVRARPGMGYARALSERVAARLEARIHEAIMGVGS